MPSLPEQKKKPDPKTHKSIFSSTDQKRNIPDQEKYSPSRTKTHMCHQYFFLDHTIFFDLERFFLTLHSDGQQ